MTTFISSQRHQGKNDTKTPSPFEFYTFEQNQNDNMESHFTEPESIDHPGNEEEFTLENEIYFGLDDIAFNLSEFEFTGEFVDSSYDESDNSTVPDHIPISNGRLVALSIFAFLFLVGIIGNALVISTAARFGSMRKVTYLYLVNLSVANLVYLLVCLPMVTVSYVLVDWPFGRLFCQAENYIMSVSMSVSVLTIVATGLDRYMAIVYPVRSKTYRTTAKTLIVIMSIWVLSLTLTIPRIHLFQVDSFYHIIEMTKLCVRVACRSTLKLDTTLCFLFLYVFPQVVLIICHVRIGQTIWQGGRVGFRDERMYQGGPFGIRERRRIAKIVIAITIVFGIGWMPVHLYHLVEDFDYGNILFGEVVDRGTVALFFSFGANALNPIMYCVISATYRKHFTNALLCRKGPLVSLLGRNEESSFRRPAPILQPRPALILPSPPRNRTELGRRLLEPHSDALSTTSPVSVEELTGIRVSDIDQISTSSLIKSVMTSSSSGLKDVDISSTLINSMSPSLILTDLDVQEEQHQDVKSTKLTSTCIHSRSKHESDNQSNTLDFTSKSTKEHGVTAPNIISIGREKSSEGIPQNCLTKSNNNQDIKLRHFHHISQQGKQHQKAESQQRNKHYVVKPCVHSIPSSKPHHGSSRTIISTSYLQNPQSHLTANEIVSTSTPHHKSQAVIEVKSPSYGGKQSSNQSYHPTVSKPLPRESAKSDNALLSQDVVQAGTSFHTINVNSFEANEHFQRPRDHCDSYMLKHKTTSYQKESAHIAKRIDYSNL